MNDTQTHRWENDFFLCVGHVMYTYSDDIYAPIIPYHDDVECQWTLMCQREIFELDTMMQQYYHKEPRYYYGE